MVTTKIQIRWNDIDQLGHVYNGQYQHFYDIGKSDYIVRKLGFSDDLTKNSHWFVMARTLNNYLSEVAQNEPIIIETSVTRVGNKSIEMTQRLINSDTKEVKSTSESVLVCYSQSTHESCLVPDWMKEKIASKTSL